MRRDKVWVMNVSWKKGFIWGKLRYIAGEICIWLTFWQTLFLKHQMHTWNDLWWHRSIFDPIIYCQEKPIDWNHIHPQTFNWIIVWGKSYCYWRFWRLSHHFPIKWRLFSPKNSNKEKFEWVRDESDETMEKDKTWYILMYLDEWCVWFLLRYISTSLSSLSHWNQRSW